MLKTGMRYPIEGIVSSFTYTCPKCKFVLTLEEQSEKEEICPECETEMQLGSSHTEPKDEDK